MLVVSPVARAFSALLLSLYLRTMEWLPCNKHQSGSGDFQPSPAQPTSSCWFSTSSPNFLKWSSSSSLAWPSQPDTRIMLGLLSSLLAPELPNSPPATAPPRGFPPRPLQPPANPRPRPPLSLPPRPLGAWLVGRIPILAASIFKLLTFCWIVSSSGPPSCCLVNNSISASSRSF